MIELQVSNDQRNFLGNRSYSVRVFDEIEALRFFLRNKVPPSWKLRLRGETQWRQSPESLLEELQ